MRSIKKSRKAGGISSDLLLTYGRLAGGAPHAWAFQYFRAAPGGGAAAVATKVTTGDDPQCDGWPLIHASPSPKEYGVSMF